MLPPGTKVVNSSEACSAGGTQPSHVLLAMGLDAPVAIGSREETPQERADPAHEPSTAEELLPPGAGSTVRTPAPDEENKELE